MIEESAGIIPIHQDSGDLLLVQHTAGHWGFPKGHLAAGENVLQAAVRELEEETGLVTMTIKPEPLISTYAFERDGVKVDKTVTYFVGVVGRRDVTLQIEELQDYAWLPYPEALERLTFSKEILQSASIR